MIQRLRFFTAKESLTYPQFRIVFNNDKICEMFSYKLQNTENQYFIIMKFMPSALKYRNLLQIKTKINTIFPLFYFLSSAATFSSSAYQSSPNFRIKASFTNL